VLIFQSFFIPQEFDTTLGAIVLFALEWVLADVAVVFIVLWMLSVYTRHSFEQRVV